MGYNKPVEKNYGAIVERMTQTRYRVTPDDDSVSVLDGNWLSSQFMIPTSELQTKFKFQAFKSSGHFKFQDTTIGGHRAVNPPPQFTRYCDIRANDYFYPWDPIVNSKNDDKNMEEPLQFNLAGELTKAVSAINFHTTTAHTGMGRFYSEALDDGAQEVYLTFGIPEFNGILGFLSTSVSYVDAYVSKTGRLPETYLAVDPIVKFFTALAMPGTFLLSLVVKSAVTVFVMGNRPFKYYYLKPAMHQYWSNVNTIVNQIATAMGILVPIAMKTQEPPLITVEQAGDKITQGRAVKFDLAMIRNIQKQFRDGTEVFNSLTNYIDVYALTCRYQNRLSTVMKNSVGDLLDTQSSSAMNYDKFQKLIYKLLGEKKGIFTKYTDFHIYRGDAKSVQNFADDTSMKKDLQEVIKELKINQQPKNKAEIKKQEAENIAPTTKDVGGDSNMFFKFASSSWESFKKYWEDKSKVFDATARLATNKVLLLVQSTGSTSESFSNSTGEISSGGYIKRIGQSAHSARFNFSGGKTGIPFVDGLIDGGIQAANSVIDNVTFGLGDVVRGLLMGAYVDVPKIWEDSSTSFPSITYTMDLVAPYGHPYSRLQNIVIPLSIILAGALPMRVGKSSYASPFLCQCFSQGVHHIRLGLITDVNITRGSGNMPMTIDRKTNAMTVSFTVTDLGTQISTPLNTSIYNGNWVPVIEEDTPFADYIDALTGRHISDVAWVWPSIYKRFSDLSKGMYGNVTASTLSGRLGTALGDFPLTSWFFSNPGFEANMTRI